MDAADRRNRCRADLLALLSVDKDELVIHRHADHGETVVNCCRDANVDGFARHLDLGSDLGDLYTPIRLAQGTQYDVLFPRIHRIGVKLRVCGRAHVASDCDAAVPAEEVLPVNALAGFIDKDQRVACFGDERG